MILNAYSFQFSCCQICCIVFVLLDVFYTSLVSLIAAQASVSLYKFMIHYPKNCCLLCVHINYFAFDFWIWNAQISALINPGNFAMATLP